MSTLAVLSYAVFDTHFQGPLKSKSTKKITSVGKRKGKRKAVEVEKIQSVCLGQVFFAYLLTFGQHSK